MNNNVSRYTPPFDEFEVDHISLCPGESVSCAAVLGPSIFVVVTGEGSVQMCCATDEDKITVGDVYFVPAKNEIKLTSGGAGEFQVYRAGVNSKLFN